MSDRNHLPAAGHPAGAGAGRAAARKEPPLGQRAGASRACCC